MLSLLVSSMGVTGLGGGGGLGLDIVFERAFSTSDILDVKLFSTFVNIWDGSVILCSTSFSNVLFRLSFKQI